MSWTVYKNQSDNTQGKIKVISFDIGGTLLNYKRGDTISSKIAHLMNIEMKFLKPYIKKHFIMRKGNVREFCRDIGYKYPEMVEDIIKNHENHCVLYEETYKTLSALKKMGLVLVSISNAASWNEYSLCYYGIGNFFNLELYSYDFCTVKPDKKMFQFVQEKLEVVPEEIVHVGDSIISDIYGAKKVNWKAVFIDRKLNNKIDFRPELEPDYIIHSLDELLEIVDYVECP